MENRANYILVGVFTLVILALSFGFIYWSANVSDSNRRVPLIVRIEGTVSGLSVGSQVLFNGLAVGAVTNLRIDPNNPRVVIATTQVDRTTPITTSTTATLGSQGLTGVSFIGLSGGNVNDRNIIDSAMAEGAIPVIRANPSDVTDILATARDISERANNILGEFERLVQEVGPAVRTTATNIASTSEHVEVFTASLAENADRIPDFVASLGRLSESANAVALRLPDLIDHASTFIQALNVESVNASIENVAAITQSVRAQTDNFSSAIESVSSAARSFGSLGNAIDENMDSVQQFIAALGPISERAESVAGRLDTTLQSVEPGDVRAAIASIRGFADALNAQSGQLDTIFSGANTVMSSLNTTLNGFDGTRAQVDRIINGINADDVRKAISDISAASANIASAADSVNNVASDIGNRREDIDRIISNTGEVTDNLRVASRQVQTLLDSVNGMVNSPDGQGLISEAQATLRSIRQTADIIRTNIGPIAANLNSFSGQGLNDVRALVREASGAISRIERAITGLANNPSRIIYGGGSGQVREFDGRSRR